MSLNPGLYSSKTPEWETPQGLFDDLDREFGFTLDACATDENAKVPGRYFTKAQDGLVQDWDRQIVWMNPPYGGEIGRWVRKASEARGGTVVCLLPARTDTRWFHDYVYGKAEVRFVKGRLRFGSSAVNAPFPSMVAIFSSGAVH